MCKSIIPTKGKKDTNTWKYLICWETEVHIFADIIARYSTNQFFHNL